MERIVRLPHHRLRVQSVQGGESMTDETWQEATDVNRIIAQYHRTGKLPEPRCKPVYGDVSQLQGDLTERLQWANSQIEMANKVIQDVQQARLNEEAAVTNNDQTTNEAKASESNSEPSGSVQT